MKPQEPSREAPERPSPSLIGCLAQGLIGVLLFVPLWAGLNFTFGTALDGPIGAVVMEMPCQRLAGTSEPLTRYTLAKGKRASSSTCHFASGPVRVVGQTDGLGFTWREFVYLMTGFAGYAMCFVGAMGLAFLIVRTVGQWFALALNRRGPRRSEASQARTDERSPFERE